MLSRGAPDPAALEATKQSVHAAATALDPAKVLQLVVQLAEKTQALDALQQQLALRDHRIAVLEAANVELTASSETLRADVDQLPAVLQRAEGYKAKWRAVKKELEALTVAHARDYDELKETAHAVSVENDDLRSTIKSTTRRFVAQLEVAEDSILSLQNEVDHLKETIREVEGERVQRRLQLLHEQERAEAQARHAKHSAMIQATPAVAAVGMQAGEAFALWSNPGRTQAAATQTVQTSSRLRSSDEVEGEEPVVENSGRNALQPYHNASCRLGASPSHRAGNNNLGAMSRSVLEPSVMQYSLLQSSDEAMLKMIDDGEILHRRQIERQIKINDRLLATVASIQREAVRAPTAPPLHF